MRLAISTLIILATVASTVPIIELHQKPNGTIIPLTKPSSWLKLDNSVDFNALDSHVKSVNAKILRGLENYKRNTGMSNSLAAVKGMELLNLKKRAVGAAALTRHKQSWCGTITVGTPPRSFTVEIDTGSSDLFLPGPTCSGCTKHTLWDPASSRTAKAKNQNPTFDIEFEDGDTVSGKQYTDNVTISGLTADIQTIGAATAYSTGMVFPPDGVLGMAFESASEYPASPFFQTLVAQGKVTEPVFSVKFASDGGELYLGGTNGDLFKGEIIYTPVIELPEGHWRVKIEEIRGDRRTLFEDVDAIIDTGAALILGDESQVAELHRLLGGKRVGRSGFYSFPCDDFPKISFSFGGGRRFEIPASILNIGPVRTDSPRCFSGIVGLIDDEWTGYWFLGAIFLQSAYTVFDFGNRRVGFADLV